MKRFLLPMAMVLALTAFCAARGAAEIVKSDLYVGGKNGYAIYRIPAIVTTAKGTTLAFTEARKNGPADAGDIDLVVKRSFDSGATWDEMRVIYDNGGHTIGNPSPVFDPDTGEIVLLFNEDNDKVLVTSSADEGATWSAPRDITKDVKPADWDWYAMGPGHAIRLRTGRLLVPCDHKTGNVQYSHVVFSDDHGKTWKLGGSLHKQTDEATAVELSDGSVMINMRNYYLKGMRAVAVSKDGGLTWSKPKFQHDLVEPVCEGSILRFDADRILFSNPASRIREKMTVKMSRDDGRTWPVAKLVNKGLSGYSDMAVLPDGTVGILYENGLKAYYEKITFAKFDIKWLTEKD